MRILSIDTTKKSAKVATLIENKKETFLSPNDASHSESLLVQVDEVISNQNVKINDFDVFGVVIGPGSFTGIRIGISIVKAFMFDSGKKCIAVNSFDLVSYNIISEECQKGFVIALNADNRGAYIAEYDGRKSLKSISVLSLELLENHLKLNGLELFVTEADKDYFDKIDHAKTVTHIEKDTLIDLVTKKAENNDFTGINELEPLYIKLSQAENQYKEKMLKSLVIKRASIENLEELTTLEKEVFETEAYNDESLKDELTGENRVYLIAELDSEIVGYIGAMKTEDNMYNILKVAVKKLYRRLEIAKTLFFELDNQAKEEGFKTMILEVKEDNKPAINFYKKHGFKEVRRRQKYYKDGKSAIVMFKNS